MAPFPNANNWKRTILEIEDIFPRDFLKNTDTLCVYQSYYYEFDGSARQEGTKKVFVNVCVININISSVEKCDLSSHGRRKRLEWGAVGCRTQEEEKTYLCLTNGVVTTQTIFSLLQNIGFWQNYFKWGGGGGGVGEGGILWILIRIIFLEQFLARIQFHPIFLYIFLWCVSPIFIFVLSQFLWGRKPLWRHKSAK